MRNPQGGEPEFPVTFVQDVARATVSLKGEAKAGALAPRRFAGGGRERAQRERLKNTHRNALDMINKLGLSDTVMKLINSRNRQDRKVVVGGFVFLFVLFYLCLRWRG